MTIIATRYPFFYDNHVKMFVVASPRGIRVVPENVFARYAPEAYDRWAEERDRRRREFRRADFRNRLRDSVPLYLAATLWVLAIILMTYPNK